MPLIQRQASTHPTSRQHTSIVRAAYSQRQDSTCPHPMSSQHIPLLRRQVSTCPSSNVKPAHILHQDSILLATGKQFHANTCYYMARKIIINRDYLLVIFFEKMRRQYAVCHNISFGVFGERIVIYATLVEILWLTLDKDI